MIHRPHLQRARKKGGLYLGKTPEVILPVHEANADEDTFVVEMTGGSNANETGAGGGLTGADLVLTRAVNTVNASTGPTGDRYRRVITSGGFQSTNGMFNAIFSGDEWTWMVRMVSLQVQSSPPTYPLYCNNNRVARYSYGGYLASDLGYLVHYGEMHEDCGEGENSTVLTTRAGYLKADDSTIGSNIFNGWHVLTRKQNLLAYFYSHGLKPPTNIFDAYGDTLSLQTGLREFGPSLESNHATLTSYHLNVCGILSGSRGGSWDQGTMVFSKKALGFPEGLLQLSELKL